MATACKHGKRAQKPGRADPDGESLSIPYFLLCFLASSLFSVVCPLSIVI
jgi:hypothetical protein